MVKDIQLALGTAQFGSAYGVAGRDSAMEDDEVRRILDMAWQLGVRVLDTAPAYGNIEARVSRLAGAHAFSIVTKIPKVKGASDREVEQCIRQTIRQSQLRLGDRLSTILFHHAEDLQEAHGQVAWETAVEETTRHGILMGASCYAPAEAARIFADYPIRALQVPGNALDQRLVSQPVTGDSEAPEIYMRSVFLQGLLLMPVEQAVRKVPAAAEHLHKWRAWCAEYGITPLKAALSVAKAMPGVCYCVVGVDRPRHLEELIDAWHDVQPISAPQIGCMDENVIDPRRWRE